MQSHHIRFTVRTMMVGVLSAIAFLIWGGSRRRLRSGVPCGRGPSIMPPNWQP